MFFCGHCGKPTSMQRWSQRTDEYGQLLCRECAPQKACLKCHFCDKTKTIESFALRHPEEQQDVKQRPNSRTTTVKDTCTSEHNRTEQAQPTCYVPPRRSCLSTILGLRSRVLGMRKDDGIKQALRHRDHNVLGMLQEEEVS